MHTKLILVAAIATTATVAAMPATCAAAGTTVTVPLALIKSVDLPGIEGDFDHFTADVKGNRLFLAAEEHHSVEFFDLQTGATLHSIDGLDTPHSILYAADGSRLFVIDGGKGGSCEVFDAASYKHLKSIKLTADADPMVYDMAKHLLYVGNGGKE